MTKLTRHLADAAPVYCFAGAGGGRRLNVSCGAGRPFQRGGGRSMSESDGPREKLAEILRIEPVRDGKFAARFEDFWGSAQGGDVLARAALAAAASCPGLELRSLHSSFLRPVPPETRVVLCVEALADGGDAAHRQVRIAGEQLLCQVTACFAPAG